MAHARRVQRRVPAGVLRYRQCQVRVHYQRFNLKALDPLTYPLLYFRKPIQDLSVLTVCFNGTISTNKQFDVSRFQRLGIDEVVMHQL